MLTATVLGQGPRGLEDILSYETAKTKDMAENWIKCHRITTAVIPNALATYREHPLREWTPRVDWYT